MEDPQRETSYRVSYDVQGQSFMVEPLSFLVWNRLYARPAVMGLSTPETIIVLDVWAVSPSHAVRKAYGPIMDSVQGMSK